MTSQVFTLSHRVTYAECTVDNHVYYGRYLEWLEKARGEFFRFLGFPMTKLKDQDVILPATECHLKYLGPARYDDSLAIAVWISVLRRVRVEFSYRITRENGTAILVGTTQHACTSNVDKPIRIPQDLTQALQPYLALSHNEN